MKKIFALAFIVLFAVSTSLPAKAANGELKLPAYKKVKLPNGMTLLLMEQHEVPVINFNFIVRAGSTADPAGKEGLASVTAELLRKGTKTRTADEISAELDFVGGELGARANFDYTNGFGDFIKKDANTGLTLLADVVLNPTFPQAEVTNLLKQRVDGLKAAKDQAQGVIGTYFAKYFYGNHPYGRPTGGDEKSVAAITRADVLKFYEAWYAPSNITLAIVGDFHAADMEKLVADKFGAWTGKSNPPIRRNRI
jgi:predicted Zn-dependent peptidase